MFGCCYTTAARLPALRSGHKWTPPKEMTAQVNSETELVSEKKEIKSKREETSTKPKSSVVLKIFIARRVARASLD